MKYKKQSPIEFSKSLIKGKTAEMIFEQMLRDAGHFTVLAFGYEKVLPELMHMRRDIQTEETMEIIRRAPDFAVISNDSHEVHLIEVKYMARITAIKVLEAAECMFASWKPSYLFIATPNGFYFDAANKIVQEKGKISPLKHRHIPEQLQQKYVALLNEFITPPKKQD